MLLSTSLLCRQTSAVAQTTGPERTFLWVYVGVREQRSKKGCLCPGITLAVVTVIIDSGGKDKILAFTMPLGDTDNGHSWDSDPIGAGSVVFSVMFRPSRNLGHLEKSIKCQVSIQMRVLPR